MTICVDFSFLILYTTEHSGSEDENLSDKVNARLAQLDRAPDYESGGQAFESLTARHFYIFIPWGAMGEWLKPRPC